MKMNSGRYVAIAFVSLIVGWFLVRSASQAKPAEAIQQNDRLVEAAQQAYTLYKATYEMGRTELDDVYRWSKRLMEAELRSDNHRDTAISNHVDRMSTLHKDVAAKFAIGAQGGSAADYHASIYYLEEAKSLSPAH